MPGGDRTGPLGAGSMTGRGAGYCTDKQDLELSNPANRFGRGRGSGWERRSRGFQGGRGFGRGRRAFQQSPNFGGGRSCGSQWGVPSAWNRFNFLSIPSKEDQLKFLQQQASQMEAALNGIQRRMAELTQDQTEKE